MVVDQKQAYHNSNKGINDKRMAWKEKHMEKIRIKIKGNLMSLSEWKEDEVNVTLTVYEDEDSKEDCKLSYCNDE